MRSKLDARPVLTYEDDMINFKTEESIADLPALYKKAVDVHQSGAERRDLLELLKTAVADARNQIEAVLRTEGRGTRCAKRMSDLQDDLISILFHLATQLVYPVATPTTSERISVAAVGGYGRGTLAAGSDIDLLFLLPYKQTPWGESVVEYCLYLLWDMGFKVGHATRNVEDSIRLSRTDMTIRTANLESRLIVGDQILFDEFWQRFESEVVRGTSAEFIDAKLEERDIRHKRTGESRYLVEPNIKDGKGGLRDLHTLFWIAKYHYQVKARDQLVLKELLTKQELRLFLKAEDFLWAVRCHLHFLTGRAEERVSFDVQEELANRLGYDNRRSTLSGVERFMRHYFLIAKDVGDLTRIVCSELEDKKIKRPGFGELLGSMLPRRRKNVSGSDDFLLANNRLSMAHPQVFEDDPVNFIRLFSIADKLDAGLHPDTLHLISRSLKKIDGSVRADPEANRLFLDILTSPRDPERILRRMNETGVLGRFIPEFGRVVAMMQFNMYHHYTVDEHLIRAVGLLSKIEAGTIAEDHPLARQLLPGLTDRVVLYVAILLHDIAKGRSEDHSIAGARVARKLCPRFGLNPEQTELVAWLIEEHLTMSTVAQSRDLADRKTIRDFAGVVQTLDRLKLLLILTVCDIRAVGPGVWNGWKGQLLRTLYGETEALITGGHTESSRQQRAAAAKAGISEQLSAWPESDLTHYLGLHYSAYWLRTDPESQLRHAEFIRAARQDNLKIATDIEIREFEAVTELTVFTSDHPRLLSVIAGACTVGGGNIVDAQIFTTTDGHALNSIFISRAFEADMDERRRAEKICAMIETVMRGQAVLPEIVATFDRKNRRKKFTTFRLPTKVSLINEFSEKFTVIEVSATDRPGLLYDLTREMSNLNLNIGSAHVATFGERAVDVFYVTDLVGHKLKTPARKNRIIERLTAAVGHTGAPRREKPSKTASKRKTETASAR